VEPRAEPSEGERDARRRGDPYLVYLDGRGRQQVLSLPDTWERISFGGGMAATVILAWDGEVSRTHALQRIGDDWALVDDGLSRKGSFVNGERVDNRRRSGRGARELKGTRADRPPPERPSALSGGARFPPASVRRSSPRVAVTPV
jgi:hypothetical protein